MKLSTRDRWLLVILPGLFLLIAYQYAVAAPLTRELKGLREQAANAGSSGQSKAVLNLTQALAESDRLGDELEVEKKRGSAQAAVFPAEWKDADRTRTLQELSRYFESCGVMMLNSSLQKESGSAGESLDQLAKGLKDRYGAPSPQYWRFELTGTYARISELLHKLSASPYFIVPVSLDMKVEDDGPELSWTVVLWI